MLPKTQEARAACQHEAAHAVVAMALGRKVVYIEVKETNGKWQGATHVEENSGRKSYDPSLTVEEFYIMLAGPHIDAQAGRIHPGSTFDIVNVNALASLVSMFYGRTVEEHMNLARKNIDAILERNSALVYSLCDELMAKNGTVYYPPDDQIVQVNWNFIPEKVKFHA